MAPPMSPTWFARESDSRSIFVTIGYVITYERKPFFRALSLVATSSSAELAYILNTFPIVRRKDEEQYGEYRTKRMVLEVYGEFESLKH